MTRISSPRLRRLDDALAALPAESEAMMISELDGYLAAVIVCPEPLLPGDWMPLVWGTEGDPSPFADEHEAHWYAGLVTAHHDAVVQALGKGQGRYVPFLEVDPRQGEVMWELWIEGFAAAMRLRPEAWSRLADSGADGAEALAGMTTLAEIARDESDLARDAIDDLTEAAPGLIPRWVETLHRCRQEHGAIPVALRDTPSAARIGRNDPCSCGSGRKHKKCCLT